MSTNTAVDEAKLNEFMGKAVGDMGAALNAALVLLGDELGLYKAMVGAGPMTADQLAKKTETFPRYVGEWLAAQAASGCRLRARRLDDLNGGGISAESVYRV